MQPAEFFHTGAQLDVGSAAGHVGGDGHGAGPTGLRHDVRLALVLLGIQHLVLDTGLHAMGWSRERAVDFLASNTALSMHEIGTEIDRYLAWPAQALAYKVGELTIWELRAEAEEALGDDFDIREFHDAVLTSGGVPLATESRNAIAWSMSASASKRAIASRSSWALCVRPSDS